MEPKIGMKFGSYASVLRDAQQKKEVQSMEMHSAGSRFRTTIRTKQGVLYKDEPNVYSKDHETSIKYTTEKYLFFGSEEYSGDYTRFSEIHWNGGYAKDLNGNGIIDKGEIFRTK